MRNPSVWIMILKCQVLLKNPGHLKERADSMSEAGNVNFHITGNKETLNNCYGHVKI